MDPPKDNPTTIKKSPKDKMVMTEDNQTAINHNPLETFDSPKRRRTASGRNFEETFVPVYIPPKKPIQTNIFSFEIKPAGKLKLAIAALNDSDLNPKGLGIVDVDQQGFEIKVRNAASGVTCLLWLRATGLLNYQCRDPVVGKMVRLDAISHYLSVVGDKDTVTIYHPFWSTELCFKFGNSPPTSFSVDLLPKDADIEEFPDVTFFCEATVPTKSLRLLIEKFVQQGRPLVSADMTDSFISFGVGKKTVARFFRDNESCVISGMNPGQRHYAEFYLTHDKSLEKASLLVPEFLLCFVDKPVYNIMLHFALGELLDVVYVMEAIKLFSNYKVEPGQEPTGWPYHKTEPWE